jgi:ABC-type lipoprotein export system ATPase subunit
MAFTIKNIRPLPLMERGASLGSDIYFNPEELSFEKGMRYFVTAPSGKGKSTFMHILYGIRKDYEGEVVSDGRPIRSFKPDDWSEMRQHKVSMVFQDLRLFPQLTAWENIVLKNNLSNTFSEIEIRLMATKLGIDGFLEQKAETLSYGQRQRVAILRALCQAFDFLFLDEPFSHLDETNIAAASELITEVCTKQNAGLILVSLGDKYHFKYDKELIL